MKNFENEPAFIIGNGPSRKDFNLKRLIGQGCTFGCNAIYRDYPDFSLPDYLIAIDPIITEEIQKSNFPSASIFIPPFAEQFEAREHSGGFVRSCAGINAMLEAIKKGFTNLN